MTRGKHGAASARKRQVEAEARVAELEAEIKAERAAAAERERELRIELQRIQGRTMKEVRELAAPEVLAARESARIEVEQERERAAAHVREVVAFVLDREDRFAMKTEEWLQFADIARIPWGEFLVLGGAQVNARQRRQSTRHARFIKQLVEDPSLNGVR